MVYQTMANVTLLSSDMQQINARVDSIKQSRTIWDIVEDVGFDEVIPVPNVAFDILSKVIEFCDFHVHEHTTAETEEFETEFFSVDTDVLFEIITAANFLDIPKLLDRSCSAAADILRGKNPEEIRKILKVENTYTKEEEEAIKKENSWAFPTHTVHFRDFF
jgi:S-phase kinase-associated protein 1